MGMNAEEGSLLVAGSGLNDLAGVTTFLQGRLGTGATNTILANYPPSRYGGNSNAAAYAIVGDGLMLCPAERAAGDVQVFLRMAAQDPVEHLERVPQWSLQHGVCSSPKCHHKTPSHPRFQG